MNKFPKRDCSRFSLAHIALFRKTKKYMIVPARMSFQYLLKNVPSLFTKVSINPVLIAFSLCFFRPKYCTNISEDQARKRAKLVHEKYLLALPLSLQVKLLVSPLHQQYNRVDLFLFLLVVQATLI